MFTSFRVDFITAGSVSNGSSVSAIVLMFFPKIFSIIVCLLSAKGSSCYLLLMFIGEFIVIKGMLSRS